MTIKVLVVDAAASVLTLAKDTLIPLGCQIISASSTALGLFLARKNLPCLIIEGVGAVNDSGLAQEIAADPEIASIPVVVVLSADEPHPAPCLRGVAKQLRLPMSPESFFEHIRIFLVDTPEHGESAQHSTQ
jgi:CheY-like chemotaxis protein